MKIKNAILALAVVSLVVTINTFAKNNIPGDVTAPTNLDWSIDWGDETAEPPIPPTVTFTWDGVSDAEKYSLDICGVVLVNDEAMLIEDAEVEWCVSFSAVDSEITIPLEDLETAVMEAINAAMLDQLGIELLDADEVDPVEMIAKVKGLDPQDKEDSKRQNNLFSEPLDLMEVD